jgi:hypothetical protein
MNTLGMCAYRAGRHNEALVALKESTTLKGKNPMDLAVAALVQAAMGRKDKAQAVADQVVEMMKDPKWADDAEVKQLLAELKQQIAGG